MADVERVIQGLSKPVAPAWCMARVAALLSPYYDRDTPQAVRQMDAEDWLLELSPYPQWAIERAVRWWKSSDNPDRRKKPLEGDIAARCKVEMRGIGSLPEILKRSQPAPAQPAPAPLTDEERKRRKEQAEAIMQDVGFSARRVPGDD